MRMRTRAVAVATAIGTGAALAGAAVAPGVATAKTTTVTVTMSAKSITLSTGDADLAAGFTKFVVETNKGEHALQIVQLHEGYTPQQAQKDVGAAFNGDVKAIHRVDTRMTWLNGASATPDKPGSIAVTLPAGDYYFVDQNGSAVLPVSVTGDTTGTATITPDARFTAANGSKADRPHVWKVSDKTIARKGWLQLRDTSDEPHFLVMQRVKDSVTNKKVRQFIASGGQGQPAWLLKASVESGTFSPESMTPDSTSFLHYRLPAGKYLVACFWPSASDGMPHFFMNMFKLVTLK